jgi:hypothetical protein
MQITHRNGGLGWQLGIHLRGAGKTTKNQRIGSFSATSSFDDLADAWRNLADNDSDEEAGSVSTTT